jgi:NADH-quinone oxidoreductase subunit C
MTEALHSLGEHCVAAVPGITGFEVAFGELTLQAAPETIVRTVETLRDDPKGRFICFIDLAGVDYPEREKRFEVVYHFLSPHLNQRIRVKVQADAETLVPSITGPFPGAVWFEREAYDMYGILFSDHPDLRRLLTDYGFDGHPLRKDFPLTGFAEVRYDDEEKRVVYEPVKLNQEFRNFDFLSPWEGTDYALPGDEKAKAP